MSDSFVNVEHSDLEDILIRFVEKCESVIAEIIRLTDFIPPEFVHPESSKYNRLIIDFHYFARSDEFEKEFAQFESLQEEVYDKFGEILKRFELLFQVVAELLLNFVSYSEQTVSVGLTSSMDVLRELEVESLYSIAKVILHFDRLITGPVRERLFVAVYRNSDDRKNVDFLVDFLRITLQKNSAFAGEYMQERVKIDPRFVQHCLSFFESLVRSNKLLRLHRLSLNLPECLFGCLLFAPDVRRSNAARMKFFIENYYRSQWVLNLSLALNVSIIEEWNDSPSTRMTMLAHFSNGVFKNTFTENYNNLKCKDLNVKNLKPEDFDDCMEVLLRLNQALRWTLLHTDRSLIKTAKDYVAAMDVPVKLDEQLLEITLKLAAYEINLMKTYRRFVDQRDEVVSSLRGETCNILSEMSQLFSSGLASIKLDKKEKLNEWILKIKKTLEEIDLNDADSRQLVLQVKRRLVQVGDMLDLGSNLAMAHCLEQLQAKLAELAGALATTSDGERRMRAACEAAHMWPFLDRWIPMVQNALLESSKTNNVRVLFQKLELSIGQLEQRFQNEETKRLISRAYSCFLERRLRLCLQSVPHHLFQLMHNKVMPFLKTKWEPNLDKSKVREIADFSDNFKLSEITYNICNLSLGISRISITKLGTVEVKPKELLEEGIRNELAAELPTILAVPASKAKEKELNVADLSRFLAERLSSFRSSFLYMCDHVGVNGHLLFREELSAALETIAITEIPKKIIANVCGFSLMFQLLKKATDPSSHIYLPSEMVWKEKNTKKESVSSHTLELIEDWIPCHAISVIERTINQRVATLLKEIVSQMRSLLSTFGSISLDSSWFLTKQFEQMSKIAVNETAMANNIAQIGQFTLLCSMLVGTKRQKGRLLANTLFSSLESANKLLLRDVSSLSEGVGAVCSLSSHVGLYSPNRIIYGSLQSHSSSALLSLLMLFQNAYRLNGSRRDSICPQSFLTGLAVLLHNIDGLEDFKLWSSLLSDFQKLNKKARNMPDSAHFSLTEDVSSHILC